MLLKALAAHSLSLQEGQAGVWFLNGVLLDAKRSSQTTAEKEDGTSIHTDLTENSQKVMPANTIVRSSELKRN